MNSGCTIGVAILTSLIASVMFALFALIGRCIFNCHRAKRFVGKYAMEGIDRQARGGTVTLEYKPFSWTAFLNTAVVIQIFAEHGTGKTPGTEDWSGQAEVLGITDVAVGFYLYPNRSGGALRLYLSRDGQTLTEHGFPNRPMESPFTRVLRRVPRR